MRMKKMVVTGLLALVPFGVSAHEQIESVTVSPGVIPVTASQSLDVTLVVSGGQYNEPALTFYQVLSNIAPGGSASYINLKDVEVTLPPELEAILDLYTPTTTRVAFSLNAPIPEGVYTISLSNTRPNSSAGGYAGYQLLAGFAPDEDDSDSYTASNTYFSVNADLSEGQQFDAPSVALSKKKNSADVDWSEAAYASAASSFDLELTKKSGKVVKTYTNLDSGIFELRLGKKLLRKARGRKFRVRVRANYEALGFSTEWSELVSFSIKNKKKKRR